MSREEGHEDAGKAVAGGEIGVGAALDGGDFDHAREPGRAAGEETHQQDQFADAEPDDLCGADVAAGHPCGEAEHGVIDQDVGCDRRDQAEDQAPMDVCAGDRADHVGGADFPRRRLVEAGGVPHRALDQMVEDRKANIDQ